MYRQQKHQSYFGKFHGGDFGPMQKAVQALRLGQGQRQYIEMQRQKQNQRKSREPMQGIGVPQGMIAMPFDHSHVTAETARAPINIETKPKPHIIASSARSFRRRNSDIIVRNPIAPCTDTAITNR